MTTLKKLLWRHHYDVINSKIVFVKKSIKTNPHAKFGVHLASYVGFDEAFLHPRCVNCILEGFTYYVLS